MMISEAASSVPGVSCTPYHRTLTKQGQACVRLAARNRSSNGFGFLDTWQVWVALGQDIASAERWLDDNVTDMTDALASEFIGGVQSITPAELVFGTTSVNGVIFEGAREG